MSAPTPWGSPSAGPPQGGPAGPRPRQGAAGCIRPFIIVVLLAGALYWLFGVNHGTRSTAAPVDTSTVSVTVTDTSADPTDTTDTSTYPAYPTDTTDTSTGDDGVITAGDCLSVDGPQPTATETVDVSNITQVDCGSATAQYKVIGVEPFTTDMNSCATDYPDSTAALLDQGPYISDVYCVVDAAS
ncbi:MAG TPA: hypothetical protein VFN97_08710 [Actinospica sp.]|nr:hypothetical protein [Actinospica sp.]